jgi:hypothetical protein
MAALRGAHTLAPKQSAKGGVLEGKNGARKVRRRANTGWFAEGGFEHTSTHEDARARREDMCVCVCMYRRHVEVCGGDAGRSFRFGHFFHRDALRLRRRERKVHRHENQAHFLPHLLRGPTTST